MVGLKDCATTPDYDRPLLTFLFPLCLFVCLRTYSHLCRHACVGTTVCGGQGSVLSCQQVGSGDRSQAGRAGSKPLYLLSLSLPLALLLPACLLCSLLMQPCSLNSCERALFPSSLFPWISSRVVLLDSATFPAYDIRMCFSFSTSLPQFH